MKKALRILATGIITAAGITIGTAAGTDLYKAATNPLKRKRFFNKVKNFFKKDEEETSQ